jgi:retinol-binding protein 3
MLIATITGLGIAQPVKKEKPISAKALVDSLSSKLYNTYIFPDKSLLMGNYLRQQLKKGAYKNITDPKNLAQKLRDDIQSVHPDAHLNIAYDPEFAAELLQPGPTGPRPLDSAELRGAIADNFGFRKTEILNGNIGYVQFTAFSGLVDQAMPVLNSAFGFVSHTQAIIIDLRDNGGGSPWMVARIASFFAQEKTRLNDIYERQRDTTVAFYADPTLAQNMKLSQPLYILTSKHTFSAAEDFTYAMQVNKRAIIVGDTTGGGAHPTRPFPIGQGFVASIPFARSINHITKTDWEGTGVRPDVPTTTDKALLEAQLHFLNQQLATTPDITGKNKIRWAMNYLKVHAYGANTDTSAFTTYCGQFKDFNISIKDNKLFCLGRFGRTFYLTPIDGRLYLGLDWLQLEFLSDSKGKITHLKLLGKAGWEEVLERNK